MAAEDQISLRQLRYFIAVSEQGSVSGAARALNVSQPAIGMQIKQLEETLGVTLLERKSQGVTLTAAGNVLQRHADLMLRRLGQARREIEELQSGEISRLVLGITTTIGKELLAPLVQALKSDTAARKLQLSFREGKSDDLLALLRASKIDAALSYEEAVDPRFEVTPLYIESYGLVGTPKALAGWKSPVPLSMIGQFPLVVSPAEEGGRRFIEEAVLKSNARLNVDLEISSALLKQEMLFRHGKCMIVPKARFSAEIQAGTLVMLELEPAIARTMKLFVLRKLPASRRDHLRSLIQASVQQRMKTAITGWLPV
jgi:LysR family transcriptional regulator, nitrogen assimilation regulatory protein